MTSRPDLDTRSNIAGFKPRDTVWSRRALVGAGAALSVAAAAEPAKAQSFTTTEKGERDSSIADPGPKNGALDALNPDSVKPPRTDHGSVPQFWQSFSLSHRRVQEGGWARQINQTDFPISTSIASVNMKLNAGAFRELHWHEAAEWSLVLTGGVRLTAVDYDGRPYVKDLKAGDLWYFPAGIPHSIQGLGPEGSEFLLVFDDGKFSEEATTLLTDWLIHTPVEVVARNFGVAQGDLQPLHDIPPSGRYIFPGKLPPPLQQDISSSHTPERSSIAFDFSMAAVRPAKVNDSGVIRIVDSKTFRISKTMAMAHVTIKPGALRELHWHTNAAEWQYYIEGQGRMTVFANKSDARTMNFRAGDVGYVPATLPHYVENTGKDDLVYLEMFRASEYTDISLNNWLANLPREVVAQHLGMNESRVASFPPANNGLLPVRG